METQQEPEGTTAPQQQEPIQEPKEETVSKAEFDRVMSDMHKFKSQLREITSASQEEKERLLREQNNWQELAELKDKEAKEYKDRIEAIQSSLVQKEKFSAIKDAAMKAGIRPEAVTDLELVGFDNVKIETTSTGRVNVLGVESAINHLKLSRPHWFGQTNTRVAGSTPNISNTGLVSLDDLNKLSVEAKKTGDYTTYSHKLKQYQQQKKGV